MTLPSSTALDAAFSSVTPAVETAEAEDRISERVLIAKLRRGDPSAFETLVRDYQDRIYDFCFRLVADREEASDLTQDVFVSIHEHVQDFREDSRLSTWIYRIGKNQCLNRLKYLNRRGRRSFDGDAEEIDERLAAANGDAPGPEQALQSKRARAQVQAAIARLDPDQRVLVALRDIEGLSYDEIVEITDLPEGTVKSRLHRAREKLAAWIGGLEE